MCGDGRIQLERWRPGIKTCAVARAACPHLWRAASRRQLRRWRGSSWSHRRRRIGGKCRAAGHGAPGQRWRSHGARAAAQGWALRSALWPALRPALRLAAGVAAASAGAPSRQRRRRLQEADVAGRAAGGINLRNEPVNVVDVGVLFAVLLCKLEALHGHGVCQRAPLG